MLKIGLLLLLSGCTASFQPWPGVTRAEFQEALRQRDANILAVAQAVAKMQQGTQPQEQKQ